jgi:glycosyltransferase involved in cell wall biosynthesis
MSRRLRVGFVIGALDAAGSERQMLALAERLPRDVFEPEFLLLSRPGVNAERAIAGGVPVHVIPPPIERASVGAPFVAWRTSRKVAQFIRHVRRRRYDVLDAWLFHAFVLAAGTRPLTRVPVLVAGRRSLDSSEPDGPIARVLKRISFATADAVVANSQQVRDAAGGLPRQRDKVRVIRNGVELPDPAGPAVAAAARDRLDIPADAFAIGMIANLNPVKGHAIALEAMAEIARRRPSAILVLVGEGLLRSALTTRAAALGIADRVRFAGRIEDVPPLLPAFDAVVQASLGEGLPNSVLEAAAAARPIVATAVGGTPEIILDGKTGLLVPPADPGALAAAVDRLIGDPGLASRLGAAARERVAATFSMDRFVSEFGDLYLELAARAGVAR